jgi:hypothetical protein
MPTTKRKANPARSAVLILSTVMGFVYLGMGTFVWVNQQKFPGLGQSAAVLGIACVLYGLFRLVRVYLQYTAMRREADQESQGPIQ